MGTKFKRIQIKHLKTPNFPFSALTFLRTKIWGKRIQTFFIFNPNSPHVQSLLFPITGSTKVKFLVFTLSSLINRQTERNYALINLIHHNTYIS